MRIASSCVSVTVILFLLACIGGCATDQRSEGLIGALSPVGHWRLIEIEQETYDLPAGAQQPTLNVGDDGSVSGLAGINRYSGQVDPRAWLDGDWSMGPLASTRMGGRPDSMAFEQRFLTLFERADAFFAGPRTMDLLGDDAVLLRFERMHE